ncbi:MAG: LysM peptidoglycan-binding domain-containing protein [Micrococcales bacterium]|nr:LysM peptidoglycan-binding domain-containing protein [Micrococcales bacterium]MCL2668476.1 LysM peptidoglycan-binding domain-containing protein [Micrococcales bacterium]
MSLHPTGVEPEAQPRLSVRPVPQAGRRELRRPAPALRPPARPLPRPSQPPLRLTIRGRVVVALAASVLLALAFVLGARAAQAETPAAPAQVEEHVVVRGETLWQIAASIAEPGDDVRDVVADLVQLNGLPDSSLLAGQTIVVPVPQ